MSATYFSDEALTLYLGDALDTLRTLPDGSVDCCVTSPPYFGQRDYGEEGQYGLEASPTEYVETMRGVFAELRRVLASDGTLWLNLGDSYARNPAKGTSGTDTGRNTAKMRYAGNRVGKPTIPEKNLLGIPWQTAFALQADGWILRQEIIWAKRNCMPDPAPDRPARAHEQVFLLSKSRRYWYDADAIAEDSDPAQVAHNQRYAKEYAAHTSRATNGQPGNVNNVGIHARPGSDKRQARSVWTVSSQPFPGAHFAVMPSDLAERCVLAGCKPGGIVLDPFSGSGTTGFAAAKHGRRYVGIDLSADYLDLSLRTRLAQTSMLDGGAA